MQSGGEAYVRQLMPITGLKAVDIVAETRSAFEANWTRRANRAYAESRISKTVTRKLKGAGRVHSEWQTRKGPGFRKM